MNKNTSIVGPGQLRKFVVSKSEAEKGGILFIVLNQNFDDKSIKRFNVLCDCRMFTLTEGIIQACTKILR